MKLTVSFHKHFYHELSHKLKQDTEPSITNFYKKRYNQCLLEEFQLFRV